MKLRYVSCETERLDTWGAKHLLEIEHASGTTAFQNTVNQMNFLDEIRIKKTNCLIIDRLNIDQFSK